MRLCILALLALPTTLAFAKMPSCLPYTNPDHPKRCYTSIDSPPIAWMTSKPHYRVYYFDDETGKMVELVKVKALRVDELGVYYNMSDILAIKHNDRHK